MSATVTINREVLDGLLEERIRLLFSVGAIIHHAELVILDKQNASDDAEIDDDTAKEIRYVLHGAQKMINDIAVDLELSSLEREMAIAADIEATEQRRAAKAAKERALCERPKLIVSNTRVTP
ncbi:MAG: hypothetical protein ACRET2_02620 [Steroidobacteraceae bacterium]